ncbi:chymotrypsin-1-like [Phlebotomus papatasi]|uniref:chymotrypsin-1-like n=1 Tax=Phlebotomus papatasi TaxID=29031 RepID=UPI002483FE85|nr:chymotrypsin-1-like [Phlebotomus papatasi]
MKFCAVILIGLFSLAASLPPQGRIVGGQDAALGQFPHMVSLRNVATGNHFCGASIISTRWVLSAAHCTVGREASAVHAIVGTINRLQGTLHQASQIINHEGYSGVTLTNDVSVVEVATPFVFNDYVRPIGVGSAFVGGGITATVSGWGQTEQPSDEVPVWLQWLQVYTLTLEDCRARKPLPVRLLVHDNTICTFTMEGQGLCFGDSGGPLIVGNTVVGIPSWVSPGCAQGRPDVYARVSSHREWIYANTDL